MTRIPGPIRKEDFRFVLIEEGKKRPYEKNWQDTNNYRWDSEKLQQHLENGGNYGVVGGYGNLVIIDADREEVIKAVVNHLPETFTVRTGGGGLHFYYICNDLDKPIRLKEDQAGDLGDVQYTGKQVVGPSSIHPNGNKYRMEKTVEIAEVKAEEIKFTLRKWTKDKISKGDSTKNHVENVLQIEDVVNLTELTESGEEYYGPHPVHGSSKEERDGETPRNFWINTSKNCWHCFRHDTGGGPILWLAVKLGIIDCVEAQPGALKGGKFVETVELAQREGLISEEEAVELVEDGEKDREVRQTVELKGIGQLEIGFSDLYQKTNSTRGSFHIWLNDNHHFEEDRKLSNQNIKRFVRDAVELTDIRESHEGILFKSFANLKDQARKEAAKETSGLENETVEKEELDVEEEEVDEYLENEPLVKLCKETNEVHRGDSAQKILARLSGYSRSLLDFPINLWPIGTSGSGKTHLLETVSRTIPNEYVLKFDSCSPKSMYYFCREYGNNALDGKITFFNEVEASEEAKELLRGLTDPAKEQNRLLSVEEQQMLEINIDGLPVSWFTSVDPLEDEQLKNRFLLCNPEEERNHKQDVADFQKENIQRGILQPIKLFDFPVLKAAFRRVVNETKDKKVVIPFDWEWHYAEDSRLQPFFGAILMTSAKIHHRQRPQTDDVIIATLEDYYIAKIVFDSVIEQTMAGVKEKDYEIYEQVPEEKQYREKRSEIAEKIEGVSTSQARHALERLTDAELVNWTREDSGRRAYLYWKTEKNPADSAISLVQDSLNEEEIKKTLEELVEPYTEIRYTQGGRWGEFEPGQVTHLAPSYMQNMIQGLKIEEEDVERLFEDCPPCKGDFAGFAGLDTEEKESEERLESVGDVKEELEKLLNDGPLSPEEKISHFSNPDRRKSANEILDYWMDQGRVILDSENCWRWNK